MIELAQTQNTIVEFLAPRPHLTVSLQNKIFALSQVNNNIHNLFISQQSFLERKRYLSFRTKKLGRESHHEHVSSKTVENISELNKIICDPLVLKNIRDLPTLSATQELGIHPFYTNISLISIPDLLAEAERNISTLLSDLTSKKKNLALRSVLHLITKSMDKFKKVISSRDFSKTELYYATMHLATALNRLVWHCKLESDTTGTLPYCLYTVARAGIRVKLAAIGLLFDKTDRKARLQLFYLLRYFCVCIGLVGGELK